MARLAELAEKRAKKASKSNGEGSSDTKKVGYQSLRAKNKLNQHCS